MSIKRFPNGSRDEETVKNETKTQSKSFLFLFLSKIVCLFVIFSTFFLRWLYHYEIETSLPPPLAPPPPLIFPSSQSPTLGALTTPACTVYTGRWNPTTNLPHLKKVPGESYGVLYYTDYWLRQERIIYRFTDCSSCFSENWSPDYKPLCHVSNICNKVMTLQIPSFSLGRPLSFYRSPDRDLKTSKVL